MKAFFRLFSDRTFLHRGERRSPRRQLADRAGTDRTPAQGYWAIKPPSMTSSAPVTNMGGLLREIGLA